MKSEFLQVIGRTQFQLNDLLNFHIRLFHPFRDNQVVWVVAEFALDVILEIIYVYSHIIIATSNSLRTFPMADLFKEAFSGKENLYRS